jgi:hypothetical protein
MGGVFVAQDDVPFRCPHHGRVRADEEVAAEELAPGEDQAAR